VKVTNEMLETMKAADRQEAAYQRRMYYHRAQYSLDAGDGIENAVLYKEWSPEQVLMWKLTIEQLCMALNSLSEKQGQRIDAHYLRGIGRREMANAEGVNQSAIRITIKNGLRNMKKMLAKCF
jgi:RNA polymerase sigma-70 factor (ECF subfamily)